MAYIQSLNRYAYALNNPTTLTDPLGLQGGDHDPCLLHPNSIACGNDTRPQAGPNDSGGSCMMDGLPTSCGVVYGLLTNGGVDPFNLITVSASSAGSVWTGVMWSDVPGTETMLNGIPDLIDENLSTPTFLIGSNPPDLLGETVSGTVFF